MENWLIISKLTILAYCVLSFAGSEMSSTTAFVLFVLIYSSLNMLCHIVKNPQLKTGLLIGSIILLMGCFQYLNSLFILLLPLNLYELVFIYNYSLWLPAVISAIPLFLQANSLRAEYILVSAFSYLIYLLASKSHQRVQMLAQENDQLREKVHALAGRLNKDLEYERQMKYSSQLEERNKIAQEIHDRVGHAIAGSLIQLEAARLLIENDRNKSRDIIQNVINILRAGMESIRATLRNIKPAAEQLGINRVKLLLDEFSVNNQITTTLLSGGNLERVSTIQWKIIQDNLNEALTNALKYSGATAISINIELLNKFIKVEVKDNGVGAYLVKKGLGLTGMEERSGSIGGKIIIDGSKGFSVITLLPVEEDVDGD